MKYLILFEQQFYSSSEHIICPYCQKEQTEYPENILRFGGGLYKCEFCGEEFEIEKEVIYHTKKREIDWESRKTG